MIVEFWNSFSLLGILGYLYNCDECCIVSIFVFNISNTNSLLGQAFCDHYFFGFLFILRTLYNNILYLLLEIISRMFFGELSGTLYR